MASCRAVPRAWRALPSVCPKRRSPCPQRTILSILMNEAARGISAGPFEVSSLVLKAQLQMACRRPSKSWTWMRSVDRKWRGELEYHFELPINRAWLRKDSAPVATTPAGGFTGGHVPFTPRLVSSAVIARLRYLSSFLSAFHVTGSMGQDGLS